MMRHVVGLVAVSCAGTIGAQAPVVLWTQSGQFPLERHGYSVAAICDAGGLASVAAGSPSRNSQDGAVNLYRGADGVPVWETMGSLDAHFGWSMACIGDADSDGVEDVIVGAPSEGANVGAAHLLSGADGHIIWSVSGSAIVGVGAYSVMNFGYDCCAIGDVNGDGFGDAWVTGAGFIEGFGAILSGRTGAILRVHNEVNSRPVPYLACAIGDRDGDGYDDYAYGSPADRTATEVFGSITIASGLTGQPLLIVEGEHVPTSTPVVKPAFGITLAAFGDWNGDGFVDLVVGDPKWSYGTPSTEAGRAQVISGADGAVLASFGSLSMARSLGTRVFAMGDVSGDGVGDFAIHGNLVAPTNYAYWALQVVDGRSGQPLQTLWPDTSINLAWGALAVGKDLDGDRIPDLVTGVDYSLPLFGVPPNLNGLVFAFDLGFGGVRPLARTRGVGCLTSTGSMPRMRIDGLPRLGTTVSVVGRAMPSNAPSILAFGGPLQIDLGPTWAPGCTVYVEPGFLMFGVATSGGYLRAEFPVPLAPVLQGLALSAQWLALDAGANSLGAVLSDVADLELQ
jgi:hypothetical protein